MKVCEVSGAAICKRDEPVVRSNDEVPPKKLPEPPVQSMPSIDILSSLARLRHVRRLNMISRR